MGKRPPADTAIAVRPALGGVVDGRGVDGVVGDELHAVADAHASIARNLERVMRVSPSRGPDDPDISIATA
jgi:hypothetical protein